MVEGRVAIYRDPRSRCRHYRHRSVVERGSRGMRNEPTLAAILAAKDVPVDQPLAGAAHRARQAGLRVAGLLQLRETGGEEYGRDSEVEHIGYCGTQLISA